MGRKYKASTSTDKVTGELQEKISEKNEEHTEVEKLRALNQELTQAYAEIKSMYGKLAKERLELLNEITCLKMDLKRRENKSSEIDRRSKAIYEKFVSLSDDIVGFIVANAKMEGKACITTADEIQQSVEAPDDLSARMTQQTQAVKPMVSGHVIERPVINLPRVSPEQLERMSQLARQRTDEAADNQPSPEEREEGVLVANGDVEADNLLANPDGVEDENLNEYRRLDTLKEVSEYDSSAVLNSSTCASLSLTTSVQRRKRIASSQNNESSVPSKTFTPISSRTHSPAQGDDSNMNSEYVMSPPLTDTVAEGHVTMRRGRLPKRRRDFTYLTDTANCSFATDSLCSSQLMNTRNGSKRAKDLEATRDSVASSPCGSFSTLGLTTSTPAAITSTRKAKKKDNMSMKLSSSRANVTKQCSVVLKRIALPKRRSSPRQMPSTSAETTIGPVSQSISANASDTSQTSSNIRTPVRSPVKRRPGRKAKPTKNLKERALRAKLRRS